MNKSRAKWRTMATKIPLQIDDIDKISQISEDIKNMLRSNSNVFLEKEAPYCFLSCIEKSYAVLTFGCNLKNVVYPFLLVISNILLSENKLIGRRSIHNRLIEQYFIYFYLFLVYLYFESSPESLLQRFIIFKLL